MTEPPRPPSSLERLAGALGDWLELVRAHEQRRRDVLAAHRRARRADAARAVAALLLAALAAAGAFLARGR